MPHQQEDRQGSPCVVGEVVSPLRGSRVLPAPGRCGLGTATGGPCPAVLTVPCCHHRPSAWTPSLFLQGTEIRDIGALLGYQGYRLERE